MSKKKIVLVWIVSVLITAGSSVYQRMTGPTYPVNGKIDIGGKVAKFKFERSHECGENQEVAVTVDEPVTGFVKYKRFKSNDSVTNVEMVRSGSELKASLPQQAPAGKVEYQVFVRNNNDIKSTTDGPIITRFKGSVPTFVLICHILVIFSSMLFSTRAGLEAALRGKSSYLYSILTVITLVVGGFILGPVMQKYSFDVYWAGWPFGSDLTDNKTMIALIFWITALIKSKKTGEVSRWRVIAASVALLAVFLIPHSLFGSEIDFTKTAIQ